MGKSSFILFETIISLIILSIFIGGFSKFTYSKSSSKIDINAISNLIVLEKNGSNITFENKNINNFANLNFLINRTYKRGVYTNIEIKLIYNKPLNTTFKVEFKEFN